MKPILEKCLDIVQHKYLFYIRAIDNKLKQYLIDKNLSENDFKKNGKHKIYIQPEKPDEFFYKNELILTCSFNPINCISSIEIKYK
jgi:hypothetical protein